MTLSKKDRAILKEKYGGRCAYCGCVLPEKGWHADHVKPILRRSEWKPDPTKPRGYYKSVPTGECDRPELDTIDNMMPACRSCNIYKSSCNLEYFRRMITEVAVNSTERTQSLRAAKRFGILTVDTTPIKFWFEKYEENNASI